MHGPARASGEHLKGFEVALGIAGDPEAMSRLSTTYGEAYVGRDMVEKAVREELSHSPAENAPSSWVQALTDAVVQLDCTKEDRRVEGTPGIASRIDEVINTIEDELERLTGQKIPRPLPESGPRSCA
jgi:hypothetical protein